LHRSAILPITRSTPFEVAGIEIPCAATSAKTIGAAKAQVAAARKLACAIRHMLTHGEPYRDADDELTERTTSRMARTAGQDASLPSARDLAGIDEKLTTRAGALERLDREEAHAG
jgi:hypothetical protein